MKTSEERKAEFDALLDRCIQLGSLLPKTLTPESSDTVELITREMVLVGRQMRATLEVECWLQQGPLQ